MARKRANQKALNPAAANGGSTDSPLSPSSTGAMDSLLEKLRAAAPQARDQRDRRRRARLKDRHQDRVASGQTMPEVDDLTHKPNGDDANDDDGPTLEDTNGDKLTSISESEDVAERAANMLQGLRDKDDVNGRPGSRDGGLKVRRKRESVEEERRNRRRRRARESTNGTPSGSVDEDDMGQRSASRTGLNEEDTIMEDEEEGEGDSTIVEEKDEEDGGGEEKATVVVSPPSPEPGAAMRKEMERNGVE